jgi:hypothetical protein
VEEGKAYSACTLLVFSSVAGRAKTRAEAAVRVKNTDEKLNLTMME